MFPTLCGTRCRQKKGGWIQELFPTHPTYQNPIFSIPRPLLCTVFWIFGFSVFAQFSQFFGPYRTRFGMLETHTRLGLGVQSCFLSAAPAASPKIHGVGNPWGGKSLENPWTNPGFLETQISTKSQGLKTSWSVCFSFFFKFCGAKFQFSGTNFSKRFRIK